MLLMKIQAELRSSLMQRGVPYCVLLPLRYEHYSAAYPVLYLLHGLFGRFDDWVERTGIVSQAARHDLIVVTPEGGDGWYSDSATEELEKYESYLICELLPEIEKRYRTISERRGRAIAGLSMGGYGAVKIAIKRPDLYTFAASFSGAFDPTERSDDRPGLDWENLRPSILKAFGVTDCKARVDNDLLKLIEGMPANRVSALPYFYFDCGNEDTFLQANQRLADAMTDRGIAHELQIIAGGHDWAYWSSRVSKLLSLADERLAPVEAGREG
jgi:putative tributyrin esterase